VSTVAVFLFNCTNPDDVISGAKPALEQVGPVAFTVGGRVIDAQWESATEPGVPGSGNDVLSYRQWKYLVPAVAEDTEGGEGAADADDAADQSPLSVRITSLYIPLVTLVAHGYGPSSFEAPAAGAHSPVPTRLRRILTGECDGSEAAAPAVPSSPAAAASDGIVAPDAYGCMLTPREAAAAETLRSAVRQARQAGRLASGDGPFNTLFVVKSARQLLFGYSDPIFEALNVLNPAFPPAYPGIIGNVTSVEEARLTVGRSRIYTGAAGDDGAAVRAYTEWNGMSSLYCCAAGPCGDAGAGGPLAMPAWGTEAANEVRGTGPSQFPRGVSPSDTLRVFTDRFVRSMDLSYQPGLGEGAGGETMPSSAGADTSGLPALRFGYAAAQFDNAAHFPPNAAYYMTPDLPDGLLNTTTCSLGRVPLFYSKPYFLGGNSSLNDRSGLPTGKRFLHDTWVDVEPRSGKTLATHMRHQTNVYVDSMQVPDMSTPRHGAGAGAGADADAAATTTGRVGGPRSLQGSGGLFPMMAAVYFPLLWIDANTQVSQAWVDDFQANVVAPTETAGTLRVVGASAAAFAGVVAVLLLLVARSRRGSFAAARRHVAAGALIASHAGHEGVRALLLASADEPAAAASSAGAAGAAVAGGALTKGLQPVLSSSSSDSGACVPRRRSSSSRTVEVGAGCGGTASTPRSMDSSGSTPSFSALVDGDGDGGAAAGTEGGRARQPVPPVVRTRSRELLRQLDADLAAIFAPPPPAPAATS
jgi:hypothetical protein